MSSPCKNCVAPKRKPGCKSTCHEYAAWRPNELERKETIKRNKAKEITHLKRYRKQKPGMM